MEECLELDGGLNPCRRIVAVRRRIPSRTLLRASVVNKPPAYESAPRRAAANCR